MASDVPGSPDPGKVIRMSPGQKFSTPNDENCLQRDLKVLVTFKVLQHSRSDSQLENVWMRGEMVAILAIVTNPAVIHPAKLNKKQHK